MKSAPHFIPRQSGQHRKLTAGLLVILCALPLRGIADIVLIVSPNSGINSVSIDVVSDLFLGKSNSLPGINKKVQTLDLAEGNATREAFYRSIAKRDGSQMTAYWARMIFTGRGQPPIDTGDPTAMKRLVAGNPLLMGYIDRADLDSSVREVLNLH
ncbi:type 2 periplasmic-binding domain-containing protein [Roseateles koreensis]|uniref:Phosphate ABC transporter substrate-binding protein n=1 Tax=Roseateles koreensis TaxID=2987526 RepID=A0ABT5KTF2_9BURK|nr:phosphate ABC transporter substrate-binding protein [Roseateles koreensis]MDC8786195.1 phosphate ABC transporter substrate-binding protein [Roseateles koreensis]